MNLPLRCLRLGGQSWITTTGRVFSASAGVYGTTFELRGGRSPRWWKPFARLETDWHSSTPQGTTLWSFSLASGGGDPYAPASHEDTLRPIFRLQPRRRLSLPGGLDWPGKWTAHCEQIFSACRSPQSGQVGARLVRTQLPLSPGDAQLYSHLCRGLDPVLSRGWPDAVRGTEDSFTSGRP